MFNRTVFNSLKKAGTRSYSSCNYDYMLGPFGASMLTISFCFLIGQGIRNDIAYVYHLQQEEMKKLLKEIKELKESKLDSTPDRTRQL